ncbi:MAG: hypothetical protein U0325_13200 [Polyangiales bacterium]
MDHAILAVELCFPMIPGDALQAQLKALVVQQPQTMRPGQKWQFYRSAAHLLTERLPQAVSGCWDFFDDNERALNDHEMGVNGMNTREGSRREPSGVGDPYRGEQRFLTFTLSLLLDAHSPSGYQLAQHCKVPEARLWTRDTFRHILSALSYVSYASVRSDVVYLIPRDDGWGLTAEDLREAKFHYLRTIG